MCLEVTNNNRETLTANKNGLKNTQNVLRRFNSFNQCVSKYIKKMTLWNLMKQETNKTLTENLALTFKSTESKVLDFFSMGGALRTREPKEIEKFLSQALAEDKLLAIKCLFYLRDIRGGQGERRTFRESLKILSNYHKEDTEKLLPLIPDYGRWDDLFYLDNVEIDKLIAEQIKKDIKSEKPSLLAKWMPSENAGKKSKELARKVRKYLGYSSKNYRKLLADLRKKIKIVESQMSAKEWDKINYPSVPSKASMIYKDAFKKHDEARYEKYLESVEKGESKINTKTLFPYEIVRKAREENNKTLELLWKNLPDYTKGDEKAIVVADVSGSMIGNPMDISVSLAMYFAERNKGIFQNKFITFSGSPELQEIKGVNLNQKIFNLENASWEMNTNIQAVFDLLLDTAVENQIKEEDVPKTIYIVSDMEFDEASDRNDKTNFEVIKQKYHEAGYEMPILVFWNVDSRQNNVPVGQNEKGVILVSGASPTIFKMVMQRTTPYEFMLSVLNSKRYELIDKVLKNGMAKVQKS